MIYRPLNYLKSDYSRVEALADFKNKSELTLKQRPANSYTSATNELQEYRFIGDKVFEREDELCWSFAFIGESVV